MRKIDVLSSIVLGFLIGVLVPFILSRSGKSIPLASYLFALSPLLALTGLYITSLVRGALPVLFQVGKFGIVGTANFAVDVAVLHFIIILSGSQTALPLFLFLTLPITTWTFFKALSFIVANLHSFFWNKFWTFEKRDVAKTKVEYMEFLAVSIVGLLINSVAFSVVFAARPEGALETLWGTIGAAAGSVAGLLWNFLGYKFFVFKK